MSVDEDLTQLETQGFCVLKAHFPNSIIECCRQAFEPILQDYIRANQDAPNRGPHRHFLPMPFDPPCFAPEFFFDARVLAITRGAMEDRIVADQWACDVPVKGSTYQEFHADYQRPLFPESRDLILPTYMLIVSFALIDITPENGPLEIAPGTHRLPRYEAKHQIDLGKIEIKPLPLEIGDVLIRHPWALHRGTPNTTNTPRPLLTIRYVRRWYADHSREVNTIPSNAWQALSPEQQGIMRFPIAPTAP
jgi:ectoine hydroxylase-related dioxygenase (phytanoyl-CoA dioxygenase family)